MFATVEDAGTRVEPQPRGLLLRAVTLVAALDQQGANLLLEERDAFVGCFFCRCVVGQQAHRPAQQPSADECQHEHEGAHHRQSVGPGRELTGRMRLDYRPWGPFLQRQRPCRAVGIAPQGHVSATHRDTNTMATDPTTGASVRVMAISNTCTTIAEPRPEESSHESTTAWTSNRSATARAKASTRCCSPSAATSPPPSEASVKSVTKTMQPA